MRIVEVVPTLEQEASGPSYSVPRLAEALARRGNDVRLMSAGGQAAPVESGINHARFERNFGGVPIVKLLEMSEGLRHALETEAKEADVVHANGLWTLPTLYPAWAIRGTRAALVYSPRGTLSLIALRRSSFRKRVFWALAQRRAVHQAALLHATSEQEYLDIRRFGLKAPVAIIPNGIDLPAPSGRRPDRHELRRILYLGRLHPIKGLEILLEAWGAVAREFPQWELTLVGPGDASYVASLRHLSAQLDLPRVTFAGPSYGAEKGLIYQSADLYVLPSFSENFGVSVAEALAHGLPVITTTGTPWGRVKDEGCGWWVPAEVGAVSGALTQALAKDRAALDEMGRAGRAWMQRDYMWANVAEQMAGAFHWVREGGAAPATIRLD